MKLLPAERVNYRREAITFIKANYKFGNLIPHEVMGNLLHTVPGSKVYYRESNIVRDALKKEVGYFTASAPKQGYLIMDNGLEFIPLDAKINVGFKKIVDATADAEHIRVDLIEDPQKRQNMENLQNWYRKLGSWAQRTASSPDRP